MEYRFTLKDLFRIFTFYTLFFATAFGIVMGVGIARGDFKEPTVSPPFNSYPPLNTSSTTQIVVGTIAANDFYVRNLGRWVSRGPKIVVKEALGQGGTTVHCDSGYQLVGCSGSRNADAGDGCGDELTCAYAGVVPVTAGGTVVFIKTPPTGTFGYGCKLGMKPNETGVVNAYCMRPKY